MKVYEERSKYLDLEMEKEMWHLKTTVTLLITRSFGYDQER